MIEEGDDAVLVAGVHKLSDKVTPCRGMGGIEIAKPLGIVKGKALVVTGGQNDVGTACVLGSQHQLLGIKVLCREGVLQLLIFVHIPVMGMEGPFAHAKLGIETPMDEHSKTEILKVGNSFFRDGDHSNFSLFFV